MSVKKLKKENVVKLNVCGKNHLNDITYMQNCKNQSSNQLDGSNAESFRVNIRGNLNSSCTASGNALSLC